MKGKPQYCDQKNPKGYEIEGVRHSHSGYSVFGTLNTSGTGTSFGLFMANYSCTIQERSAVQKYSFLLAALMKTL